MKVMGTRSKKCTGFCVLAFGGGVLVASFLPPTVLAVMEAAVIVAVGVLACL